MQSCRLRVERFYLFFIRLFVFCSRIFPAVRISLSLLYISTAANERTDPAPDPLSDERRRSGVLEHVDCQ